MVHYRHARSKVQEGNLFEARQYFELAIQSGHPDATPLATNWLGRVLARLHDMDGARRAFTQASQSGHSEAAPRGAYNLGELLLAEGNPAGARRAFEQAFQSGYYDAAPRAAYRLGEQRARQGDVAGARSYYQKALQSGHRDATPRAAANLGRLLAGQGDAAGARSYYLQAIQSQHRDAAPQAANNLGRLLAEQGDAVGARFYYDQAIQSQHEDAAPRAHNNLGLLLAEQGDVAGARVHYDRAIYSACAEAAQRATVNRANLEAQIAEHDTVRAADHDPGTNGSSMTLNNREWVGRGLELMATGLGPFVHARMTNFSGREDWADELADRDRLRSGGQRRYSIADPGFLLQVVTEEWGAFKDQLTRVERALATELRETRNKVAHHQAFSADDTYRALDTIERLLVAVGAPSQASEVRRIRIDLQPPHLQ
jgi:Tfp pilus assembly protein PilF